MHCGDSREVFTVRGIRRKCTRRCRVSPLCKHGLGLSSLCLFMCVCLLLQCGEQLQLQLTEAHPDLLEIGNNQDENKKLLDEHDELLAKLKVQNRHCYIS